MRNPIIAIVLVVFTTGCETMARDFRAGWRCGDNPTAACRRQSDAEYNYIVARVTPSSPLPITVPRTVTTTYERDGDGNIGRVSNSLYESRIRYNRSNQIREIKTRWK